MRKLVTIRNITDIQPIEGADRIEEVWVDGWSVVCQKGIHKVGDTVLYFELDSFLPESDKRFESFMKFGTRTFDGVLGHRIKTVRLKGVYSQGIIMPLSEFPEIDPEAYNYETDYSEAIGIVKWEAPQERGEGMGYQGDKKGDFPWFIRKSDQERIQNLYGKLSRTHLDEEFVGTLKMDGSSITVYFVEGDKYDNKGFGYCSRNQELKIPDLEEDYKLEEQGKFFQGAVKSDLFTKSKQLHEMFGSYYAIQGELVGAGIQGNFEKFDTYQVFAYNIFDIEKQEYVDFNTFQRMAEAVDLQTVPVIYEAQHILREPLKDILELSNIQGLNADYAEGVVWREVAGTTSFKAINNVYLEKN